jgi:hypothetical protein
MTPRAVARSLALGRIALGGALLVAPRALGATWMGTVAVRESATPVARALGARDLLLGVAALRTLDDAVLAPRVQRALAACDAVDLAATLSARRALPRLGTVVVVAMAAAGAAGQLWTAQRLGARGRS